MNNETPENFFLICEELLIFLLGLIENSMEMNNSERGGANMAEKYKIKNCQI